MGNSRDCFSFSVVSPQIIPKFSCVYVSDVLRGQPNYLVKAP